MVKSYVTKRGKKVGLLTSRQREIIEKLAKKEKVSRQTKYDVYSIATKNAKKAIEDLTFLAQFLPETKQKKVFNIEKTVLLINNIMEYSKFETSIKITEPGRGHGIHQDDELRKDKKFVENRKKMFSHPLEKVHVLPKDIQELIQHDRNRDSQIWRQIAGKRVVYPSYNRQLRLAHGFLDSIYANILFKIDPERGKLLKNASVVLSLDKNGFRFFQKASWLSDIFEEQMNEQWFQDTVEEWLTALKNEIGGVDERMKKWIFGLMKNILFKFVTEGNSKLDRSKIIVFS